MRAELDLTAVGLTCTNARYTEREDFNAADYLVRSLVAHFASEAQTPYVVSFPATWWQHFKQRFFPPWLLRKFPVRLEKVEVGVKTVYPYLRSQLPPEVMGRVVCVQLMDRFAGSFRPDTDGMTPIEWRDKAEKTLLSQRFADTRKCPGCGRPWFT